MNQILKSRDQILKEMVKLSLDRDSLIEWLVQNMDETTTAQLYITDHYIQISISRRIADKNEM